MQFPDISSFSLRLSAISENIRHFRPVIRAKTVIVDVKPGSFQRESIKKAFNLLSELSNSRRKSENSIKIGFEHSESDYGFWWIFWFSLTIITYIVTAFVRITGRKCRRFSEMPNRSEKTGISESSIKKELALWIGLWILMNFSIFFDWIQRCYTVVLKLKTACYSNLKTV